MIFSFILYCPIYFTVTYPGATCESSNEATSQHRCTGAIDGLPIESDNTQWASSLTNGNWYKVLFPGDVHVVRLGLFSKCKTSTQCDRWSVTFSDGTTLQVSHWLTKTGCNRKYWVTPSIDLHQIFLLVNELLWNEYKFIAHTTLLCDSITV